MYSLCDKLKTQEKNSTLANLLIDLCLEKATLSWCHKSGGYGRYPNNQDRCLYG